jgi:hypothetical protein
MHAVIFFGKLIWIKLHALHALADWSCHKLQTGFSLDAENLQGSIISADLVQAVNGKCDAMQMRGFDK